MKKNISLIAFLGSVLFSGAAFGQTEAGQVKLNVHLYPIISLEFQDGANGTTGGVVDLIYNTQENYTNGVEVTKNNHFKVTSMGGFTIKAKAANLTHQGNSSNTIESGKISVKLGDGTLTPLNTNFVPVYSSQSATSGKPFNVVYKGIGNDEFKSKYVANERPTIYTTQVIYSVEAI